ncbi:site-specific integrase [Brucella sp. TWI432]
MKLTKRTVDGIVPTSKDTLYWDEEIKGFGVKVTPAGKKIFVLQSRLNGSLKRFTIGAFGAPWSADAARDEAKRLLGEIVKGVDPHEAKRSRRNDITIQELGELYWELACAHKKPVTIANEKGLMARHIVPLFGRVKVSDIRRTDIQKFINDVATGKTAAKVKTKARGLARVTGGKGSANRTLGLLSSMLSFAVENGYRSDNPALGTKQFKLKTHDRYLTPIELDRLGKALDSAEKNGVSIFAVAAIRFLAMTGCRRNEALTLQWSWIDFEHRLAKLPDSKTGQKVLHLGESALALIQALPKIAGSPLVFPSSVGGDRPLSIQKIWDDIRSEADLRDLRIHDLRHNFASMAVSSGKSLYLVGKLLGHSQSQTTQRYAHLAPDPIREAANSVSNIIGTNLISGSQMKKLDENK